ncbi:MAG: hypothetical protein KME17_10875 [Cyanosarcina radialis HA8281-LM2]|nr:hypothetical protein [Cyanosarcina radialis HA8281-LM2]
MTKRVTDRSSLSAGKSICDLTEGISIKLLAFLKIANVNTEARPNFIVTPDRV